jgi:hypothetical protein
MRIIDFLPDPYRNLIPHTIRFTRQPEAPMEEGCSIRFLVGKNGTGKTNILRFLTSIFIALQEGFANPRSDSPAYNIPFHLSYQLRQSTVSIESKGSGRSGVSVQVQEQGKDSQTYAEGEIPSLDLFFPKNILVYTSGDQNEWHSIFHPAPPEDDENIGELDLSTRRPEDERPPVQKTYIPDESSASDSPKPDSDQPEGFSTAGYRRVNLATSNQLKLALLSALLDHQYRGLEISALKDALQEVSVRLLGFSLQIHINETVPTPQQRRALNALYDLASFPNQRWDDQQWVYDINQLSHETGEPLLNRLINGNWTDPFQFFQTLVSLQDSNLLADVKLVLEYTPQQTEKPKRVLLSDDLSDGEFAFLSRMALIYLLNEEECLFLLDEPEVHFNDDWKRNLVDSIERALKGTHSEVILTSHASIVLTDAYPDEVILMTYAGQRSAPRTLGGEPGELLQSVLGARQTVGKRAIRKIQKALESGDEKTLQEMLKQVGPGLYRFNIVEELQRVSLSKKD